MKRGGRPRIEDEKRRSLSLPPVKVNAEERSRIEEKAKAAHLSISAWQRYAALERNPPRPRVIPPINQESWLQLAADLRELRHLKLYFLAEGIGSVVTILEEIEKELKAVRHQLLGVKQ